MNNNNKIIQHKFFQFFMVLLALVFSAPAISQIKVTDDTNQIITLNAPAKKVITLSPGLTELIYAAGGANYIKGVVSYSDYPEQAKKLAQVGSYNALDIEKILVMQPDLIIAWKSGNPKHQIEQLIKLGLTVYISEPKDFMDIPVTIKTFGQLMATDTIAKQNADRFTKDFNDIKKTYQTDQEKELKRTFIQIWDNPVMSVNEDHLISKVITLCGGNNIFSHTKGLTNSPSIESILEYDPEIIIATGMADSSQEWLNRWEQWKFLNAVKNQRLYATNPDHLVRHTPRILKGIKDVCQLIHGE
ncbi:MAG: cobalamin-binding protein [Gammaproteobacteria bacterium]|nr:cobalamin-binding protein [Gammaproteobacteria bacterium]